VQGLLRLPAPALLSHRQRRIADRANVDAESNRVLSRPRFEAVQPTAGTDWQTKDYFRRAIEAPGKAQITRPYLSSRPQALRDSFVRFRGVRRVAAGAVRRSRFCGARARTFAFGVSNLLA